ncbi:kinase-like domain-containing protein [Hypoxylon sp. FL0543]|nr:kinase-like domain-containing protein [Hypoxylon sp. FL0543]
MAESSQMGSNKRLYYAVGDDGEHVEDREKYRPGGYHPIHFDEYIDSNKRFQVLHKLGWGESSTVWLCYDEKVRYYRSVKVMTSEASVEECRELQITKTLAHVDYKELRDNYIALPREHFWIEGPNGRHLCFVSDLLGPSLSRNSPDGMGIHTPDSLTDLAFQLNKFTVMELTDRQLNRYLGPRQYQPLEAISREGPKPHGPDYLALPVSLDKLERKCRTGRVAIVDFGDSFQCSNPPSSSKWHRQYAGPELLFTDSLGGLPRDIWALACTIYEIKLQTQLFSKYESYTSLIRQMEVWFGPLPAEYRKLARSHLERDKEQRPLPSNKGGSSGNVSPTEDKILDSSRPISLSLDEERRMREMFVGKSGWAEPLQASLGKERDCYIPVMNNEAYSSSDDTDFETDRSQLSRLDQASEDERSEQDMYTQADIVYGEVNIEGDLSSEESSAEIKKGMPSPLLQTPRTPEGEVEQSENDTQLAAPTSTEVGTALQDRGSNKSEADSVRSSSSPRKLLGKREANESMSDGGTKRQRTGGPAIEENSKWVKRVISMPREEVLLLSGLLLRMFKHDPKERIDIDAVVNHDFWGDRRDDLPTDSGNSIEQNPDPISSRTRSRALDIKRETESGSPKIAE